MTSPHSGQTASIGDHQLSFTNRRGAESHDPRAKASGCDQGGGVVTLGGSPAVQTGVGFLLRSAHSARGTGAIHGHTYEVVCWFPAGDDAEELQAKCERSCADLDHAILPEELAWAEALVAEIMRRTGAEDVEIRRPLERLYARPRR